MSTADYTLTGIAEDAPDSPDKLRRGDRGARQSRRWLASEIPLDKLLATPYGEVPFTWLLQQELVAHHVPSVWLPQINPAFLEVKLFLSGKVMDEARHAEACVKRLWLNGHGPAVTGPATDGFLAPLAAVDDYEQASLLVDILGEGQTLDIFKIVYDLAPDEATRRIVLLSRRDEARHVSYGVARLRHRFETASDRENVGRQVAQWIAERIESSDEFFVLPDNLKGAPACSVSTPASTDSRAPERFRRSPTTSARPGSTPPAYRRARSAKSGSSCAAPDESVVPSWPDRRNPAWPQQFEETTTTAVGAAQERVGFSEPPQSADAPAQTCNTTAGAISGRNRPKDTTGAIRTM